jgi:hypothetical protein
MAEVVSPKFMTPEYWHERADEVRAKAEEMHGPEARVTLLELARGYERLAERAEYFADRHERCAAEIAELRYGSRRKPTVPS